MTVGLITAARIWMSRSGATCFRSSADEGGRLGKLIVISDIPAAWKAGRELLIDALLTKFATANC